jgi:hypothetical protein
MRKESARHFRALTLRFELTLIANSRKLQSDGAIARATLFDMPDCVACDLKHRLAKVAATSVVFPKVQ